MFTSDIYVRGKYASWLKFLSEKTEKNDKSLPKSDKLVPKIYEE